MSEIYQVIELKEPMMKVDIVTCKKCNGRAYATYFEGFYECKSCNILTNQVSIIVSPVTCTINIVGA